MPCATQNELDGRDAEALVANGVKYVAEVSNMGCTPEAADLFIAREIPFGPGKAVNAGGVATSGPGDVAERDEDELERGRSGPAAAGDHDFDPRRLRPVRHRPDGYVNYMKGANIAGFMKVARSMVEQGVL